MTISTYSSIKKLKTFIVLISLQVFSGNTDGNTIVSHKLREKIRARYVRFVVLDWNNHISMRVELYGCSLPQT